MYLTNHAKRSFTVIQAVALGEFANSGKREFAPVAGGENNDWVLVLDDGSNNFPLPGKRR